MPRFSPLIAIVLLAATSTFAQEAPPAPKSVIFLVGDGMGVSQVTLGRMGAKELGQPYHFDRFAVSGLADTQSANSVVTDSAAAATALATGVRTKNWSVGLNPEGDPLETLLEVAHRSGYRTGVVTNTRLSHATPASFTTHAMHRNQEGKIAAQQVGRMVRDGFPHVFLGGGLRVYSEEQRAALSEAGYTVVTDPAAFAAAEGEKLVAILSGSHLPWRIDRPESPTLAEITAKAVTSLAKPGQPFALMVEGGRIDHAGHSHDAASMLHEQLDFDAAVGWALDYAEEHSDVLVVVTADHATGAMGISEHTDVKGLLAAKASPDTLLAGTKELTAAIKRAAPQLARADVASRAQLFRDLHKSGLMLEFERRLAASHGLTLSDEEVLEVFKDGDYYWQTLALGHLLSERRGTYFYDTYLQHNVLTGTHGHDGGAVPVFAFGPGAEAFGGLYENDQIPVRISTAIGLPQPGSKLTPSGQK